MAATLEKVLLALVVVFCGVLAYQSAAIRPPAHVFALAVTGATAALATLALARAILSPLSGPIFGPKAGADPGPVSGPVSGPGPGTASGPRSGASGGLAVIAGVAGLVAYTVAMSWSYLGATLAFLFLGYLFLMPERSPRNLLVAACVALAMTGFTWLCFSYWLGVNLP